MSAWRPKTQRRRTKVYEYVLAPDQDVVISSRVRLSRNYEDLPLSPKLTRE